LPIYWLTIRKLSEFRHLEEINIENDKQVRVYMGKKQTLEDRGRIEVLLSKKLKIIFMIKLTTD
jgi:hypothetical protein